MKPYLFLATLALLIGVSVAMAQSESASVERSNTTDHYSCSIHPEAKSDKSGTCSQCRMSMEKKTHAALIMATDDLMNSMHGMKSKINGMTKTGYFDLDFATLMIMHHQAAIDMSWVEIVKGRDSTLIALAHHIIAKQNGEFGLLQSFVNRHKNYKPIEKTRKTHDESSVKMKAMMESIMKMNMTGDTDRDFARMMIPHHKCAVKMARNELSHGKDPGIRKMAKKMIHGQVLEIDHLKTWLSGNP